MDIPVEEGTDIQKQNSLAGAGVSGKKLSLGVVVPIIALVEGLPLLLVGMKAEVIGNGHEIAEEGSGPFIEFGFRTRPADFQPSHAMSDNSVIEGKMRILLFLVSVPPALVDPNTLIALVVMNTALIDHEFIGVDELRFDEAI